MFNVLFFLLRQWPTFKLFGITYVVGKIKFLLSFQGPLAKWVLPRLQICPRKNMFGNKQSHRWYQAS